MSTSKKTSTSKIRLIITILSITTSLFLVTVFLSFAAPLFVNAIFQNQHNFNGDNFGGGKSMTNNGFLMKGLNNNNIPQINGTINLKNSNGNIPIKNMSVSFLAAAQSAQKAIVNGKIIGGHIGVTQGFLTYNFVILNPTNNTISHVRVDAGNGKVLYTSPSLPLNSTQFAMRGMNGGFGGGHWRQDPWGHDGNRGW